MSILIVESGSTKTDWCFLFKNKKPLHLKTSGINPLLQSEAEIMRIFKEELNWNEKKYPIQTIFFYGAGLGQKNMQDALALHLKNQFQVNTIEVNTDMVAAARSLCGNEKGVVCILGTGSNCCFFDGKKIKQSQPSLGFIAGDEGSGNYMGKKILQYYAYNTFDDELKSCFENHFGNKLSEIINRLYKEPFPNRLLASFVIVLTENRGHFMVENIAEDAINEFFQNQLLKFRQSWKYPIHFTGSIAYLFKDTIAALCQQYEFELGNITQSPMKGLIQYHS